MPLSTECWVRKAQTQNRTKAPSTTLAGRELVAVVGGMPSASRSTGPSLRGLESASRHIDDESRASAASVWKADQSVRRWAAWYPTALLPWCWSAKQVLALATTTGTSSWPRSSITDEVLATGERVYKWRQPIITPQGKEQHLGRDRTGRKLDKQTTVSSESRTPRRRTAMA